MRRLRDRLIEWREDRLLLVTWLLAVLPILVAAIRAVTGRWVPLGDDALVAIRAHDVLTQNHPWLGTWSSASLTAGVDLNHPGPLLFDAIAPAVRLFGMSAGTFIGVAFINISAVSCAGFLAHRRGGRQAVLIVYLSCSVLGFAMGSSLLVDPWNPHVLLLSTVALLVAAWGVAEGDPVALIAYVTVGSFCVQTHLGFVYLVPGLLVCSGVMWWRSGRKTLPRTCGLTPRRTWWVVSVIALLLWSQPIAEQFFGSGRGNLARILDARSSSAATIGVGLAVRLVSSVVFRSPLAWRSGFIRAVPDTPYVSKGVLAPVKVHGFASSAFVVLVVLALIVVTSARLRRHSEPTAGRWLGSASGAIGVAFVSVVIMPVGPVGLSAHQMRWLWPVWINLGASLGYGWARLRRPTDQGRRVSAVLVGAIALMAFGNLAPSTQAAGPMAKNGEIAAVRSFDQQLGSLAGRGPIWFDSSNTPVFDNWSTSVLAELVRRDIEFTVNEPGLVRQFGNRRRSQGDSLVRLRLFHGAAAFNPPPAGEVVALWSLLTPSQQQRFNGLQDRRTLGDSLTQSELAEFDQLLATANSGSIAAVIDRGP